MKATEHYNLPLYEPNDLADLTDGYNNAMELVDTDLYTTIGTVEGYNARITANETAISDETARAEAAENANTSSINEEIQRATAAENANTSSINEEIQRATAAESKNADAITKINTYVDGKFPITTENIADAAVTAVKLNVPLGSDFKIVTVGDSYSAAESTNNTWTGNITKILTNATVYNYGVSGAGFTTQVTFYDQLTNAKNGVADANAITHVIIGGGRNDIYSSTYQSSAATCIKHARECFPNARIIVVPMMWDFRPITTDGYNKASVIQAAAHENGAEVLNYAWIWGKGNSGWYQSDQVHPNATGAYVMANYICNAILGCYTPRFLTASYSMGSAAVRFTLHEGVVEMRLQGNTGSATSTNFPKFFSPIEQCAGVAYVNGGSAYAPVLLYPGSESTDPSLTIYGIQSSSGTGCTMTWLA